MENPFLQVTPAQALSQMIGTCILQPLKLMGNILSDFAHHSTSEFKYLSHYIYVQIDKIIWYGEIIIKIK